MANLPRGNGPGHSERRRQHAAQGVGLQTGVPVVASQRSACERLRAMPHPARRPAHSRCARRDGIGGHALLNALFARPPGGPPGGRCVDRGDGPESRANKYNTTKSCSQSLQQALFARGRVRTYMPPPQRHGNGAEWRLDPSRGGVDRTRWSSIYLARCFAHNQTNTYPARLSTAIAASLFSCFSRT